MTEKDTKNQELEEKPKTAKEFHDKLDELIHEHTRLKEVKRKARKKIYNTDKRLTDNNTETLEMYAQRTDFFTKYCIEKSKEYPNFDLGKMMELIVQSKNDLDLGQKIIDYVSEFEPSVTDDFELSNIDESTDKSEDDLSDEDDELDEDDDVTDDDFNDEPQRLWTENDD